MTEPAYGPHVSRADALAHDAGYESAAQQQRAERPPCRHDSTRRDGTLDCNCLRCGADGYWHDGHRHDRDHPSGKVLLVLDCPDDEPEGGGPFGF